MVITKNLNQKFALISVFDKGNLRYLCTNLKKYNYKFISTGSTGNKIRGMGFKCKDISKITKFKEMLDGRVKTINSNKSSRTQSIPSIGSISQFR